MFVIYLIFDYQRISFFSSLCYQYCFPLLFWLRWPPVSFNWIGSTLEAGELLNHMYVCIYIFSSKCLYKWNIELCLTIIWIHHLTCYSIDFIQWSLIKIIDIHSIYRFNYLSYSNCKNIILNRLSICTELIDPLIYFIHMREDQIDVRW